MRVGQSTVPRNHCPVHLTIRPYLINTGKGVSYMYVSSQQGSASTLSWPWLTVCWSPSYPKRGRARDLLTSEWESVDYNYENGKKGKTKLKSKWFTESNATYCQPAGRCLMHGGKVLVHCNDGMSRAPALVGPELFFSEEYWLMNLAIGDCLSNGNLLHGL